MSSYCPRLLKPRSRWLYSRSKIRRKYGNVCQLLPRRTMRHRLRANIKHLGKCASGQITDPSTWQTIRLRASALIKKIWADRKGSSGGGRRTIRRVAREGWERKVRREQKVVLKDRLFSRYWDAGGVQGSIKGIKWYFFRMLRGQSYPACFSQGDALVAPLARRPRVRFVVVLNWNRKRTIVFECTSKTKVLREIYSIVVRFFLQPFSIYLHLDRFDEGRKERSKETTIALGTLFV